MRIFAALLLCVLFTSKSFACSLRQLDQDSLKAHATTKVTEYLANLFPSMSSNLNESSFTYFQVCFPQSLGADCSGVDAAYSVAVAYLDLYATEPDHSPVRCELILKTKVLGYGETGKVEIEPIDVVCI